MEDREHGFQIFSCRRFQPCGGYRKTAGGKLGGKRFRNSRKHEENSMTPIVASGLDMEGVTGSIPVAPTIFSVELAWSHWFC